MNGALLLLCILMILFGIIRFGIAKWRHEDHANLHILWIPGSAFLFAMVISVCTWVF